MPDSSTLAYWIDHFGIAIAILIMLALAFWKACGWWGPRIEKWAEAWTKSNEKTQETHRNVASASLDLQKSNSITLQGLALTLKAVHDRVQQFPDTGCALDAKSDSEEIRRLRSELRVQRKLSASRPVPDPPSSQTPSP